MKTFRYDDRRNGNTYEADFSASSEFIKGRCLIDGKVSLSHPLEYASLDEFPEPARTEIKKKAGLSN